MPLKSKKYLVTTEKYEVVKIQQNHSFLSKYCLKCKQQVEMLTIDATTSKTGKSNREIFQLTEKQILHFIEVESGQLLICRKSLTETGITKERNK